MDQITPRQPLPPADLMARVSGASDPVSFDQSGARSVREWALALSVAGKTFNDFPIILDFGAGCGRTARHLRQMLNVNQRLLAADVDEEAIAWLSNNIEGVEGIALHGTPAPIPDSSIDLIVNHSVFTHLPEDLQLAWLDDLRRILKPGGLFLGSFHGRATTKGFSDTIKNAGLHDVASSFLNEYQEKGFIYRHGRADYEQSLPDWYASAFHTIGYVERVWFPSFDCLAWLPQFALGYQDLVVLRRRAN